MDPSPLEKLPGDLRALAREAWHGRLALLADHHVATYVKLFSDPAPAPYGEAAADLEGEEGGRGLGLGTARNPQPKMFEILATDEHR